MIWGKLVRTAFSTAYLHFTSVVESGTTSTVTSTHFSVYLWEGGLATAVRLGERTGRLAWGWCSR